MIPLGRGLLSATRHLTQMGVAAKFISPFRSLFSQTGKPPILGRFEVNINPNVAC